MLNTDVIFFLNIFDPYLFEPRDMEPLEMERWLYLFIILVFAVESNLKLLQCKRVCSDLR